MKEIANKFQTKNFESYVVDNLKYTFKNYHWCSDLSIFDGIDLIYIKNNIDKEVYCYETKEKFKSISFAKLQILKGDIGRCLNNPDKTAGGYHWCTDLSIFDGVELTSKGGKEVYCYETKQKFKSNKEACTFMGIVNNNFYLSVDNPNSTAAGYHWCTSLDIFDNKQLLYPLEDFKSYPEIEIVEFLKDNTIENIITSDRKILSGKELDIYLPDYNLAIEFNGDYWHSDKFKSINYHQDKVLLCLEKGIELISIFEFQWNENKELYLNYILDRINNIDRPDLELDENNNHNLQFCNKKYFTECYEIIEPQLMNNRFIIYDCGKLNNN